MIDRSSLWEAWPLDNAMGRITALFGGDNKQLWPWWDGLHNGLDFRASLGEPVRAVRGGRVFEVREDPDGYGKYLKIGSANDHELYAHLDRWTVRNGDMVTAGDVIGHAGSTGNSTGVHLHIGKRVASLMRYRNALDGWVNPLPFAWQLLLRQHNFKLSDHWDAYHRGAYDDEALRRWRPPVVKLLKRSYMDPSALAAALDVARGGSIIILRNWEISVQHDALFDDPESLGAAHAAFWDEELGRIRDATGMEMPRHLLAVEGLNEPPEWRFGLDEASQRRGAAVIARYSAAFATAAARHLLSVVTPNLSVGWPGNGGVTNKPPHWDAYQGMRDALTQYGGLLSVHEYCSGFRDGNGLHVDFVEGWLIGRYRTSFDAGFHHVFVVVTETGIDNGLIGRPGESWMNSGLSAADYMGVLQGLDEIYAADAGVLGACIFSRDGVEENWGGFDIRHPEMMERIIDYAAARREAYEPPSPDPETPPEHDDALAALDERMTRLERWAASF